MTSSYQRWKGIMKCYPFEEKRLAKWQPPYIVQPKYDGVRCRAERLENGEFVLLSSEENIIYSVPHINEALKAQDIRFNPDGELYFHGASFEQIVSITSRTVNLAAGYSIMQYHIFDIVSTRKDQTHRSIDLMNTELKPPLFKAPFWLCEDLDGVMRAYDEILSQGYEGIIVRHHLAPYEAKRSLYVMKFKPKKKDDYEVVGYEEEISIHGVPKNSLGALVCLSGDGTLFRIGTGFTAEDRKELWRVKESLKGKVAKVQYQHLTSGKKVPRFPVFVSITNQEGEKL